MSPVVICPGEWSDNDLRLKAEEICRNVASNASCNCLANKVIVTSAGWPQREAFLQKLREGFAKMHPRAVYYPGSMEKLAAFRACAPRAPRCRRSFHRHSKPLFEVSGPLFGEMSEILIKSALTPRAATDFTLSSRVPAIPAAIPLSAAPTRPPRHSTLGRPSPRDAALTSSTSVRSRCRRQLVFLHVFDPIVSSPPADFPASHHPLVALSFFRMLKRVLRVCAGLDASKDEVAFREEPWATVLSEVPLKAETVPDFLESATQFCNNKLWGTLSATIFIHPREEKAHGGALSRFLREMRYGAVAVNTQAGVRSPAALPAQAGRLVSPRHRVWGPAQRICFQDCTSRFRTAASSHR